MWHIPEWDLEADWMGVGGIGRARIWNLGGAIEGLGTSGRAAGGWWGQTPGQPGV